MLIVLSSPFRDYLVNCELTFNDCFRLYTIRQSLWTYNYFLSRKRGSHFKITSLKHYPFIPVKTSILDRSKGRSRQVKLSVHNSLFTHCRKLVSLYIFCVEYIRRSLYIELLVSSIFVCIFNRIFHLFMFSNTLIPVPVD